MNLNRLRRITSDGNFIPQIDGLRLLAIALVIVDHIHGQIANHVGIAWPALLSFADGGRRGVKFFFVISGFILGLPFARRALCADSQNLNDRSLTRRICCVGSPGWSRLLSCRCCCDSLSS